MKAMIFAAGLGTRLKPLTNTKPKALVELNGITLLEILIQRLKKFEIREIIVNAHHFADQIQEFIKQKNQLDIQIEVSAEGELLDTGGGLKKASWFFDDGQPFLVHNVDVLTDLDYQALLDAHKSSAVLATLAVRQRQTNRYFLFDDRFQLCGWESISDQQKKIVVPNKPYKRYSFMGIHLLSPEIFQYFPNQSAFSIVETYLDIAEKGQIIRAYDASTVQWLDVGRKEQLEQAAKLF